MHEHNISYTQVEFVEVGMSLHLSHSLRFNKPTTGYQGKFSMQYNMAAAILDGRVDIDSFGDEKANSPEMREALSKGKVTIRPEWVSDIEGRRTPVRVKMKNGQEYTSVVEKQKGHPENPLSEEELQAKYSYCAERTLPKDKVEASIKLLQSLEKLSNIIPLMDAVTVD